MFLSSLSTCSLKNSDQNILFSSPEATHGALFCVYPTTAPTDISLQFFFNSDGEVWGFGCFTKFMLHRYRCCAFFWNSRKTFILNICIFWINNCCRVWLSCFSIGCVGGYLHNFWWCWIYTIIVAIIFILVIFIYDRNIFQHHI